MKLRNRFLATLLAGCMLFGVTACGGSSTQEAPAQEEAAAEEAEAEAAEEPVAEAEEETEDAAEAIEGRTIIDHDGHEVTLPDEINRIVISSLLPMPSVYCLFDGSADKLVGMHPSSMAAAQNSQLAKIFPNVLNASTDFVQGGVVNAEELIKLEPDIVIYAAGNEEEYNIINEAGLTAVGISARAFEYDCVRTFEEWVKILGEIFNEQDKAAGIADYGYEVHDEIQAKLDEAGEDLKRPRAMILFNYGAGSTTVGANGFFSEYWLTSTGAVNVATELTGTPEVNMEQIYEWDPEIIYITNFSPALPEDLYTNAVGEDDWSSVTAVKNKQVYKMPLGMYRWFPPASDTPLVLQWLAKHNQPELFKDIDMEQEMKDYYQRFYGVELTDDDINEIFNPAREASGHKLNEGG